MRVIAGKARRINLKAPNGMDTRPTTDRIKETLFNMINTMLYDATFLDLFSGSGAIGIEALSRGAKKAYFVENDKNALACIKDNLNSTRLLDNAIVLNADVFTAINRLNENESFDIIFMDPPYNMDLEKKVLELLANKNFVNEETLIIIEASLETTFDYLEEIGYYIEREKQYKTNKHVFVRRDI
ncbi:MAG: 16S rRNA (guanine(966)-N(2))-methyltransferase RsmD [Lachnospira sp.]|nr:16S rRNA (guanine(966)-N(2))-methyltransferase RsmD [Lachnospira sp.]